MTCDTYAERVRFPDDVLTDEEEVVLHLRPHARAVVRPIVAILFALAVTILAWVMLPDNSGGRIGVTVIGVVAAWFALTRGVWPLLVWRCTHWVFTDARVLTQEGVLTRERRDVPLARVNDHALTQSLWDRLSGCGTVTIDSIGDQAVVLRGVPGAQELQTTLYQLIEEDHERPSSDEEPAPSPPSPAPEPRSQPPAPRSAQPALPQHPSRRSLPRGRPPAA